VNQDLKSEDYEIIVVNDGSTDSSPEIALRFQKKHDHVKVIQQENQGLSAARNRGIEEAIGKYIYFIDSDDYIAHHTLPYALAQMEKNDLDILGFNVMNTPKLDESQSRNFEITNSEELKVSDGITYIAEHYFLNNVWWYITRREFLLETGLVFPVGRYVEDAIFTSSLIAKSKRIAKSSLDFYRYVVRPNSIMSKRSKEHNLKMIRDYELNVYDFAPHIDALRGLNHPDLIPCLNRLEARQHSFVFFMLVKCIKYQLTTEDIKPILSRLKEFGAYPINKAFKNDYNNITYNGMQLVMNRQGLFLATLNFLTFTHKIFPNIYGAFDRITRFSFKLRSPR
jgi:glycosyltransferase involved in cell wall biosynthesis